ncbi:hypothetical protein GW17_00045883 [Ensete ventricosum]|nr:hypothetical protein GW17_00045883 [Ensete ventricosum]
MEKYEKLEKVGEGTYGKVYKAQDKATGQLVALKKTRLEMDEEGIPPTALREISLLQLLSRSIYIVRLLNVEQVEKNGKPLLYLVFEYLDTDLKKFIDSHRRGPNPRPIPSPIIQKGILKIADLGLGRAFTIPLKSYTHELSGAKDLRQGDCVCSKESAVPISFPSLLGTPTEEQWPGVGSLRDWHAYPQWKPQNLARAVPSLEPEGVDLLSKMLQYDPANRISAKAAMEHPYFDSLDKSQF